METRDTGTQHKLRMPPELKEKLFASAKEMNRSLNAEVVARLEKSFDENNKVMLLEEESIKAMESMVSKIVNNAVSNLIQQGVEPSVIQDAFTMKGLLRRGKKPIDSSGHKNGLFKHFSNKKHNKINANMVGQTTGSKTSNSRFKSDKHPNNYSVKLLAVWAFAA